MKINNTQQLVPFGNFIIQKPDNKEVKEKTSFIGYDYMIKFNAPYKNRAVFPCKAKILLQDICEQVGLTLGNTDFINCEYMILGNPFTNNENCRTVLSNIAQLAGGFAKIGRDNKVYIKVLKNISNLLTVGYVNAMTLEELNLTLIKALSGESDNTDEKIDGNNYFDDFAKNKEWGELNSLVLGLSGIEGENTALEDKESIKENGLTEITISDNYFLTNQKEREKIIVPIWNSLKGLKYLPFKTKYYGYPYLDSGDMIYLQDTKDIGHISYVFNHTFKFNGGFSGNIETPALTKTQTAYKNTFDLKTKFKRVERTVNKIEGKIEDVIEKQSETTEQISKVEQTVEGITQNVKNVEKDLNENYSTTEETNSKIEQEAGKITNSVTEKIENIQVGGTNLVANSAPYNLEGYGNYGTIKKELIDEKTSPSGKALKITAKTAGSFGIYIKPTKDIEIGKQYSYSVWIKANRAMKLSVGHEKGGTTYFDVTTQWKKYTYTYEAKNTSEHSSFLVNTKTAQIGDIIYIHSIKLEEGNKVTAWSPAPNDNATKSEMNSIVEQEAGKINIEVSKKVGKDEIISSINQSAEQVKIKANKISLERERD